MPWVRAKLRDNQVYVRVDQQGKFVVHAGRAEVRYRPKDGRLYRANPANLTDVELDLLPDDTCSDAEAAPGKPTARDGRAEGQAGVVGPDGWEAWTDGACSGNPGPAGLGVVLLHGDERVEISEYLGRATNNIAELTAILRALERVPPDADVLVRTDSQYSIGVLQKGWKAKANQELIARIQQVLRERRRARLVYTPGHAGVSLNERADQLAPPIRGPVARDQIGTIRKPQFLGEDLSQARVEGRDAVRRGRLSHAHMLRAGASGGRRSSVGVPPAAGSRYEATL
ncbi:MAG: ribonuclease HI [Polyangiaceae bacterium]|nr:ribonuclease HI [Polyangiaceae bacterium]